MSNTAEATVRDAVLANPRTAAVFEEAGIDYCCGGDVSLSAACARAGIEVNELLRRIELAERDAAVAPDSCEPSLDWAHRSLKELTDYVVAKRHAYTRRTCEEIRSLLGKVASAHGDKYPAIKRIGQIFEVLEWELSRHMDEEEGALFPSIARLEARRPAAWPEPARYLVPEMVGDHLAAGEMLREIRRESGDFTPPEHACDSFRRLYRLLRDLARDLHWHVHLENNVLFPRAMQLLARKEGADA